MKKGMLEAFLTLASLVSMNAMAAGQLKLHQSEVRFSPGESKYLTVENIGNSVLYIKIEQQLLLSPGHTPEELIPLGEIKSPSLLASPTKLVLQPGQTNKIELNTLRNPASTKVWRITLIPVEEMLTSSTSENSIQTPIHISVTYGAVIYQTGTN